MVSDYISSLLPYDMTELLLYATRSCSLCQQKEYSQSGSTSRNFFSDYGCLQNQNTDQADGTGKAHAVDGGWDRGTARRRRGRAA